MATTLPMKQSLTDLGKHQHKPGLGPAAQIESDLKDEERSTNQRIGTLEKSKGSFRERAQKIVSLMEQSSRERNEDFESIEEIQVIFFVEGKLENIVLQLLSHVQEK